MTQPDLRLVHNADEPAQAEMPFAVVQGEPLTQLPRDLYIDQIPDHRGNKVNVIDYLGEQDDPDGGGH